MWMCTKEMLLLLLMMCFHGSTSKPTIVDLTHTFDETTIYWPGDPPFQLDEFYRHETNDSWMVMNNFSASEHGGTHMDAPYHFCKHCWTVDKIPLEKLSGPVAVIDISTKASENPDVKLTVDDITDWEKKHGLLQKGVFLFLFSGWDVFWPNKTLVLGNADNNASDLHFPGLDAQAAQWLVDNRQLTAFGIDTPSMDHGPSTDFPTHDILLSQNIYGLENLNNLGSLPPRGATVQCSPYLIGGGTGAPTRVIARWGTDGWGRWGTVKSV